MFRPPLHRRSEFWEGEAKSKAMLNTMTTLFDSSQAARENRREMLKPWIEESRQLLWIAPPGPDAGTAFSDPRLLERFAATDNPEDRVLVVAAGEPYCLDAYPAALPRLRAWGSQDLHARAVARWLADGAVDPAVPDL